MPCFDDRMPPTEKEINHSGSLSYRQLEALVCGLLTQGGGDIEAVNWKEVGFPKSLAQRWWARHQKEDAERHRIEAEKAEESRIRARLLGSLTPNERRALGFT